MTIAEFAKEVLKKPFGVPKEHGKEKEEHEVVEAPEFDLTQYAKKLGVGIGILLAAVIAALKAAHVEEVTEPAVLVGALGVVAAGLLGMSFVMAMDLAARAYLTGEGAAEKKAKQKGKETKAETETPPADEGGKGSQTLIPVPPGTLVWLKGETDPRPVLAMAGDDSKIGSYLVAAGLVIQRDAGLKSVAALEGSPSWHPADEVQAIRPTKWS